MKPLPQSIHDRAKLLASVHSLQTVAELLHLWPSTITRMKQSGWKARDYSCKVRPRPNDFAIQARHMTNAELVRHYRSSFHTVGRWLREKPVRGSLRGLGVKGRLLLP